MQHSLCGHCSTLQETKSENEANFQPEGSRVSKMQQQNSIALKDATTKLTYLS